MKFKLRRRIGKREASEQASRRIERLRSQYIYWIELKKLEYRLQGRVSDPELMVPRKRSA